MAQTESSRDTSESRIVIDFLRKLSVELDKGHILCLKGLLFRLASGLEADSAGVLGWDADLAELRTLQEFSIVDFTLVNALPEIMASFKRQSYEQFYRFENLYVASASVPLYLQRLWLPRIWLDSARWEFWLFLLKPRALTSAAIKGLNRELVSRLRRAPSEWFQNLQEALEQRTGVLSQQPRAEHDILKYQKAVSKIFTRPVFLPVEPRQLHEMLSKYRQGSAPPIPDNLGSKAGTKFVGEILEWTRRAQEDIINKVIPKSCTGCICSQKPGFCPQSESVNICLAAVGELAVWETGFWLAPRPDEAEARSKYDKLLLKGVAALRSSISVLDRMPVEMFATDERYLSLTEGREAVLIRFFLGRAISESLARLEKRWCSRFARPGDLKFPAKLAELTNVILSGAKWTDTAIEALLYVVAEYGHKILGIPERLELVNQLRQTLRGESALHTLKQRYRDHFFHTIEVCLLGFAILTTHTDKDCKETLGSYIISNCRSAGIESFVPINEADFLAQWWTAALIHDTAYGIDILSGTRALLSYFKNSGEIASFDKTLDAAVAVLGDGLAKIAPEEFHGAPELKKGDHGLIAANALLALLNRIDEKEGKRYMSAVRAIAFHNSKHPKISAAHDPVAALLILCDTIQDWGRTQLGFHRSPAMILSRLIAASKTPTEDLFGPAKRFALSITAKERGNLSRRHLRESKLLEVDVWYGRRIIKDFGVFYQWADVTQNLQRVDFEPWNFSILLRYHTPICDDIGQYGDHLTQFDEMVRDRQAVFLKPWVDAAYEAKGVAYVTKNWCIHHEIAEEQEPNGSSQTYEIVSYNLPMIGKRFTNGLRLMAGSIGDFSREINAWHGYSRRREPTEPEPKPPV